MTNKINFCKKCNLSEDQFSGKEKINGDLHLSSLTSIPEGFNPTVGGDLDLGSITSIPEGFNPTVGGDLYLRSITSIPEGFNPTVGGDLYLRSLTSIPEGFNPTVGGYLDLRSLTSIPEGFNPTVGGDLDLRSLTSIPEGFNPTVGGDLDLSSLTSIPEGFNPTVGGYLDLSSLTSIPEGFNPTVVGDLYLSIGSRYIGANIQKPIIDLSWQNGRYKKIDGIFCEMTHPHPHVVGGFEVYRLKKVNKDELFFLARKDNFYAHGKTIDKAVDDLRFKVIAEKLKKEPIHKDTVITRQYYRVITGACEFGVNDWMQKNNITKEEITAEELMPILEKTHAYGLDRFKALVKF